MGADLGIDEVLAGAALALHQGEALDGLVLVGDEAAIRPRLKAHGLHNDERIRILPAQEVITPGEKPIQALKQKKDASLVRAIEQVKEGNCAAAVSCGNTGALMACATLKLRPMEGVSKPALSTVWPSRDHHFVLLDAGANPQCKPENLLHSAILGNAFARDIVGIQRPRVGLLTIGTEEGKGNELTAESHELLKRLGNQINYAGLIEGFDVFQNKVDVVVTDGFTGNVLLKTCEGLWKMLKGLVKEEVKKSPVRMAGAWLMRGALHGIKHRLDPDRYGGALLLGLRGTVVKAHGSSNRQAIRHAIRIAGLIVRNQMQSHISQDLQKANQLVRAQPDAVVS